MEVFISMDIASKFVYHRNLKTFVFDSIIMGLKLYVPTASLALIEAQTLNL